MDPLKDAAGSSFGKADRLCTCMIRSCRVEELQHQLAHQCSPNIIGIWEWGICGLMGGAFVCGQGIYHLMGGSYGMGGALMA